MAKDPRKLRQWHQLNEIDYAKKLTDEERQWLHTFNSEHFKKRPREDALDRCSDPLTDSIRSEERLTYQAPQTYLGVTLSDLKLYLRIERKEISERKLSIELEIARTTLQYRMQLVKRILQDISWPNLFGNLSGDEKNDEGF